MMDRKYCKHYVNMVNSCCTPCVELKQQLSQLWQAVKNKNSVSKFTDYTNLDAALQGVNIG